MDLSKYYKKGITGLENLGNTCFLNSCMQVINHTYELNSFLDSNDHRRFLKSNLPDSNILVEWNDLRSVMWSGNGVVSPNKFVHNVHEIAKIKGRDIFTGWAQNDMPEFLLFFIDCLHNSISRSVNMKINGQAINDVDVMALKCYEMLQKTYEKEYSEIMALFYGIYVSEIISTDEKKIHSMKPEHYFILDLPVIDGNRMATNLYGCFDLFTKTELMEGDNAWFNEKTGKKEDVKKRITLWNFPNVMVISLKRFTPDGTHKINAHVDFPLEDLDLSKYTRGYKKNSYKYDLFGVCNHMGGVMGGHYTAFVKNAENKWLHCNDTSVNIVDDPKSIITPMAYCLFYRKKNNLL
jgi:ubiquitin carboxyl-terminal hydrolase 8